MQNLLDRITSINKNYKKYFKISGENFNVFKILKVDTREVKLHSAFIAELLNPYGSHDQGNVFIKEFVDLLKLKNKNPLQQITFEPKSCRRPELEKWLGAKTDTEGGYIDILLTDITSKHIIIENKIYAGDQINQLLRYQTYDPTATIVYITLEGRYPENFSTQNKKEILDKLLCISYKEDILEWLQNCRKYTVDHSLLRETLNQYINTIKYLTHQTMNEEMKNEIIESILRNEESYLSARQIQSNFEKAKLILRNDIQCQVVNRGKKEFQECKIPVNDIVISFQLNYEEEPDDEGFYFGFVAKDLNGISKNRDLDHLLPIISELGKNPSDLEFYFKGNDKFIGWIFSSKRYTDGDELCSKLTNTDYRKEYIEEIIKEGHTFWEEFKKQVENLKAPELLS